MKLRAKTLVIVATTLVFLLAILYAVSRQVLIAGFSKVERENTVQNVQRMLDAFSESVNNLSIKSADWSKWDDTYKFIEDKNKGYLESNLKDQAIGDLKINYLFLIHSSGKIVFGRGFDLAAGQGFAPSEQINSILLADSSLIHHPNEESAVAGLIMSPSGPLAIASRPIVTSEGKGPIRGTVLFARYLDSAEIGRVALLTHLSLTVRPWSAADLPGDMAKIRPSLSDQAAIATQAISDDSVAGYGIMKDIHGKPLLLGRVNLGRAIYKQGQITMLYLINSILIAGFIFGIIILLLLEKSVISRVAKLSRDVNDIGSSGDNSKRVALGGKDELAILGHSMNKMLGALQRTETVVRERNLQMRMIMNTVPSGLLSLDERFKINPEYAQSVEEILGRKNLAGQNFFEAIGLGEERTGDRQKLFDFLDLLRQEVLPEKEMAGLNPFEELKLDAGSGTTMKWLRLRYCLIKRGADAPTHFLVVVEDITEEKALAEKVRQSERENLQLKAIVEDPDLFRDFLNETWNILKHAEEKLTVLPTADDRKPIVNEVFRDVHTIKGTAASFGLSAVAEIAGRMEDGLSPLRETGDVPPELIAYTNELLTHLTKAVMDAVESAKKIMGDEIGDDCDIHLKISLAKLKGESAVINELLVRELVDKDTARELRSKIESELYTLRQVPARKGLGKALKIVPGLVKRLQKNVSFHFEGAEVPIDCEIARELNTPLVHMIRNAFDHGIEENADERTAHGKSPEGHVTLSVQSVDHTLVLTITDDGRGLNPNALKQVAIKKGILSEEEADKLAPEEAFALIYRPGFSTADSVTDVSGRGVGMDAVLTSVTEKLCGDVSISSEVGRGSTFTIRVPIAVS